MPPTLRGRVRMRARSAVILALATGLALTSFAPSADAYHQDRYDELQRKIADARKNVDAAAERESALLGRIAESDRRHAELTRDLAAIEEQLGAASARLQALEAQLDRATAELRMRTAQLEHAIDRLAYQTDLTHRRARDVYMSGPVDYTMVLLAAQDLSEAIDGYQYAKSVLEADMDLIAQMERTRAEIEGVREAVALKREEIEQATRAQEEETRRITALRDLQAAAEAAVRAELEHRTRLLEEVRDEKEAYEQALRSYEEESSAIADFLRRQQQNQRADQGGNGYLSWPVSGRITSGYGWRTHPVHGARSFHAGIDIAAPQGTSIGAARAGEVLATGYQGAYGLTVIIDHGNSVATLYAHLSQVYVRPGDRVATLASIGAVGCTGWCTGPHLHFEVRVGGEHQNPMNWL